MMDANERPRCPHCGGGMKRWQTPPESNWEADFQWVCFNDDCPYFKRGWEWLMAEQGMKASYRHRMNPRTGCSGPLPVFSSDALKGRIIDD